MPAQPLTRKQINVSAADRVRIPTEIAAYARAHYATPVNRESMGRKYNLPGWKIGQLFEAIHETTLHHYVRQLRLEQACRLLLMDLKIDGIATDVGYQSKKNFYRAFKAVFNMRPGEWRRQQHERQAQRTVSPRPSDDQSTRDATD